MSPDNIDRSIIQATQSGLPLTPEPYQTLAEQLNLTADEVMARLSALSENGIIRRIGAVPNHYKLGYRYNGMTVWDVDDDFIDTIGNKIGQLHFVSHCYHRPRHRPEWPYNLFAMVHSKTLAGVNQQIEKVAEICVGHYRQRDVLYSTRILKKKGLRIAIHPGR